MDNETFPITPPHELVQQWWKSAPADAAANNAYERHIATQAANWGADQELEACCEYISQAGKWFAAPEYRVSELRLARRSKPPSLKELALEALDRMDQLPTAEDHHTIRRALEQLDG